MEFIRLQLTWKPALLVPQLSDRCGIGQPMVGSSQRSQPTEVLSSGVCSLHAKKRAAQHSKCAGFAALTSLPLFILR